MEKNKEKVLENQEQYGNESFGIPKNCEKKQKFNGMKLAFYMVVVALVCCLIYTGIHNMTDRYLPEMSFDKSTQPIVYVKGKDLVAKPHQEKKGRVLASSKELYEEDGGRAVSLTKKGKKIFFVENRTSENTFDLYCRNLTDVQSDKKAAFEKNLVAEQVETYTIHPGGKFVLYLKNGNLFFWDTKRAYLVSNDVTEYYLSENGQYVVYYKEGGRIYTCSASKNMKPMLVDADIQKVVSKKNAYNKIYYLKNNALFLKEIDKQRELVAEQVEEAVLLDDVLYYVKKEPYTWLFEEIFMDDRAEYDQQFEETKQNTYVIEQPDAQEDAKRYEEKAVRDSIRVYFETHPVVTDRYRLYQLQGDKSVLLDSGLVGKDLTFRSCRSVVVYERYLEEKEKTRISTMTSVEEALKEATRVTENAEIGMGVLVKDRAPYVGLDEFPKGRIEISLDGKYLYCLEDIGTDAKGVLVRYRIGAKALKGRLELSRVVSDFTVDGADSSVAIVFDGSRMGICMDETYTHLSENRGPKFFYVDETLYFLDEYNPDVQAGGLMRFRNGKIKQIDSNVHDFDVRNLKTVAYIKNFSRELGFGDLYQKEGNRAREKVDICVRNILH